MNRLSALIKGLVECAAKNFAAHNHIWSTPWIAPIVIAKEVGGTKVVQQKKVAITFCSECSALNIDGNVFTKSGEPNLYTEEK
jgi:hypothetical protein